MGKKTSNSAPYWKNFSLIVPFAAFVITILDIVLLERKFNVFSGGYLQTSQIVTFADRLKFCGIIFLFEFSFAASCWYLLRLMFASRNTSIRLSCYQFILAYGGGSVLALIAKYKILSYFGDFIGMAVMRNLGGGNLQGALLYSLEDGQVLVFGAGAIGLLAWIVYRRLQKKTAPASVWRSRSDTRRLLAGLAVALTVLISLAYSAHTDAIGRRHFRTVTPYWLANEFNTLWRSAEPSTLALLSAKSERRPKAIPSEIRFGGRKDNLILVVSESTRADVLDATIDGKPVTPNWRLLGSEGSIARQYYSHTGFTTSSLKAIFNGALNSDHPLSGTLFELLKKNGYQIVVLSGQDETFGDIAKDSNLESGADIFFDARSAKNERVFSSAAAGSLALSNPRVVEQFDKISAKIDWKRPVFMYVNFQAAHFPYYHRGMQLLPGVAPIERADISQDKRDQVKRTYLNAVSSSDAATGQLVDRLKTLGVYDNSLVVVSGDHGESLFDDGILGHGVKITDSQLHTLLVSNRQLPEFGSLLGGTQLAHAMLLGVGATDAVPAALPTTSVIHFIGDLNSPSELGYTYADGRRMVLDTVNAEINGSRLQKPIKVSELPMDSLFYLELLRLVSEWRAIAGGP